MTLLGLENKVVLVTGENRGIGAATVNLLLELCAKVAYTYRQKHISPLGTLPLSADVTSQQEMAEAIEEI